MRIAVSTSEAPSGPLYPDHPYKYVVKLALSGPGVNKDGNVQRCQYYQICR